MAERPRPSQRPRRAVLSTLRSGGVVLVRHGDSGGGVQGYRSIPSARERESSQLSGSADAPRSPRVRPVRLHAPLQCGAHGNRETRQAPCADNRTSWPCPESRADHGRPREREWRRKGRNLRGEGRSTTGEDGLARPRLIPPGRRIVPPGRVRFPALAKCGDALSGRPPRTEWPVHGEGFVSPHVGETRGCGRAARLLARRPRARHSPAPVLRLSRALAASTASRSGEATGRTRSASSRSSTAFRRQSFASSARSPATSCSACRSWR